LVLIPKHSSIWADKRISNFNPLQENYKYLNADSSAFNGIVYSSGNLERFIQSYLIFDEFTCLIELGFKKRCTFETFAYYPVRSIEEARSEWKSEEIWIYYSNLGAILDSIKTNRFDQSGELTFNSRIHFEQGIELRTETHLHKMDTLFHGHFVNNKIHGDWIETAQPANRLTLNKPSKIKTSYNQGILTNISDSNVYFMNQKNQIVDLSTFLRICSDKDSYLIKFYEFDGQNKEGVFYHFIVATANPEYSNGIPEDQMQFIRNQLIGR
jgi:hypothetical protein